MEMEGKGAEDIEMGAGGRRDHVIHAGMAIIICLGCRALQKMLDPFV
jgi:hypothetical protein